MESETRKPLQRRKTGVPKGVSEDTTGKKRSANQLDKPNIKIQSSLPPEQIAEAIPVAVSKAVPAKAPASAKARAMASSLPLQSVKAPLDEIISQLGTPRYPISEKVVAGASAFVIFLPATDANGPSILRCTFVSGDDNMKEGERVETIMAGMSPVSGSLSFKLSSKDEVLLEPKIMTDVFEMYGENIVPRFYAETFIVNNGEIGDANTINAFLKKTCDLIKNKVGQAGLANYSQVLPCVIPNSELTRTIGKGNSNRSISGMHVTLMQDVSALGFKSGAIVTNGLVLRSLEALQHYYARLHYYLRSSATDNYPREITDAHVNCCLLKFIMIAFATGKLHADFTWPNAMFSLNGRDCIVIDASLGKDSVLERLLKLRDPKELYLYIASRARLNMRQFEDKGQKNYNNNKTLVHVIILMIEAFEPSRHGVEFCSLSILTGLFGVFLGIPNRTDWSFPQNMPNFRNDATTALQHILSYVLGHDISIPSTERTLLRSDMTPALLRALSREGYANPLKIQAKPYDMRESQQDVSLTLELDVHNACIKMCDIALQLCPKEEKSYIESVKTEIIAEAIEAKDAKAKVANAKAAEDALAINEAANITADAIMGRGDQYAEPGWVWSLLSNIIPFSWGNKGGFKTRRGQRMKKSKRKNITKRTKRNKN